MRAIAVENGDEDISITVLDEAKCYLTDYCPNLTLLTTDEASNYLKNTDCEEVIY
jgi:hypothetical protein